MDTDNLALFENDIITAQRLCASINDKDKRNRAVANVVGTRLAASYFDSGNYTVDVETGLHNVASLLEKFEISDIYINNLYVDVRVYFSDEEICVPKIHFDTGILPTAYMFIKLSQDLSSASVQGFIYPERVNKSNIADDAYFLSPDDLESFYNIESRLLKQSDVAEVDEEAILNLLDGQLSDSDIISVLKESVKSKSARLSLIQYAKAQSVFNFISVNEEYAEQSDELQTISENNDNDLIVESSQEDSQDDLSEEDLDNLFDSETVESDYDDAEYTTNVTPSGAEVIESLDNENYNRIDNTTEQLESLFTGEQEGVPVVKQKKRSSGFFAFLIFLLLVAGGFYLYQNNLGGKIPDETEGNFSSADLSENTDNAQIDKSATSGKAVDAMPVETVENKLPQSAEAAISQTSVPAIERSLDASVLVSNLKIDWEVPEGYASNTAAKRYFVKIGKVIQLNLKTELLLLQKPPLSNRITVELKYNPTIKKFETVKIKDSSGEKSVDDLILKTVDDVLKMSVSANMDSVSKFQGAPLLIIRL